MPVAFRSATTQGQDQSTNQTATRPTGTAQGDFLLAICSLSHDDNATTVTSSGWSIGLALTAATASGPRWAVLWKNAGASEPANYTFTKNGGTNSQFIIHVLALTGVDASSPFAAGPTRQAGSANTATITAPSLTAIADSLLVTAYGAEEYNATANSYSFSTPAGMTERTDAGHVFNYQSTNTEARNAGATGTRAATFQTRSSGNTYSSADGTGAIAMVLRSANSIVDGGTAELAGAGSISAGAVAESIASSTISGAGSISADSTPVRQAQADVRGAGSLASSGTAISEASATLAGAGSLSVAAIREQFLSAVLNAAGSITAPATQIGRASGNLAGAGRVQAGAQATYQISALLKGAGSFTADGRRQVEGGTQIRGAGSFTADGLRVVEVSATLAAAGSVFADIRKAAAAFFISRTSAQAHLVAIRGLNAPPRIEGSARIVPFELYRIREPISGTATGDLLIGDADHVAVRVYPEQRLEVDPLILGNVYVTYLLRSNYLLASTYIDPPDIGLTQLMSTNAHVDTAGYGTQYPVYALAGQATTRTRSYNMIIRVARRGNAALLRAKGRLTSGILGRLRGMDAPTLRVTSRLRGLTRKTVVFGRVTTARISLRIPHLRSNYRLFRAKAKAEAFIRERADRFVETTAYALGGTRVVHDRSVRSIRGYVTAVTTGVGDLVDAPVRHPARAHTSIEARLMPVRHLDQVLVLRFVFKDPTLSSIGKMSSVVRVIPFTEADDFHETMPPFGDHTHDDDGRIVVQRAFMGIR